MYRSLDICPHRPGRTLCIGAHFLFFLGTIDCSGHPHNHLPTLGVVITHWTFLFVVVASMIDPVVMEVLGLI